MATVLGAGLLLIHKVLAEFSPSLVDAHGMADDLGAAARRVWKLAALHPGILKPGDRIDRVKQAEKPNLSNRSGECLAKTLHEVVHLLGLELCLYLRSTLEAFALWPALPLSESFPSELYHLLIPV